MQDFRGNTVLTFDQESKGAIVLEHLDDLNASIRRWLEKNMAYIEFVVPIENALAERSRAGHVLRLDGADERSLAGARRLRHG